MTSKHLKLLRALAQKRPDHALVVDECQTELDALPHSASAKERAAVLMQYLPQMWENDHDK